MLRLIFLACLAMLPGCSCDALWASYEVRCSAGSSCPDAAMSVPEDMASPQPGSDGGTPGTDGGSVELDDMATMARLDGFQPPPFDMSTDGPPDLNDFGMMPFDMKDMKLNDMLMAPPIDAGLMMSDMGVVVVGELGVAVITATDSPAHRTAPETAGAPRR